MMRLRYAKLVRSLLSLLVIVLSPSAMSAQQIHLTSNGLTATWYGTTLEITALRTTSCVLREWRTQVPEDVSWAVLPASRTTV